MPDLRLLLLSSSRDPARSFLDWAAEPLLDCLGGARRVAFVPYAGVTIPLDEYADRAAEPLARLGCDVRSVHRAHDPVQVVRDAEAVVIGGGNTFRLLQRLHETGLLVAIGEKVRRGAPYVGWSAGSNVACPTIRTTNDMPVVEPPSLAAMGFVPFQLNPHYTDFHPPGHMGETRAQRLEEFCILNPTVNVVGLREGSILSLRDGRLSLLGAPDDAALFRDGRPPRSIRKGDDLSFLLRDD